jgi:hypothetical protein
VAARRIRVEDGMAGHVAGGGGGHMLHERAIVAA